MIALTLPISHVYNQAGDYSITLTITDDDTRRQFVGNLTAVITQGQATGPYTVTVNSTEATPPDGQPAVDYFTITRDDGQGDEDGTYPGDLTVNFTLTGDAQYETDYTVNFGRYQGYVNPSTGRGYVTIPAGQASATIEIDQVDGDVPQDTGALLLMLQDDAAQGQAPSYTIPNVNLSQLDPSAPSALVYASLVLNPVYITPRFPIPLIANPLTRIDQYYNLLATEWNNGTGAWHFAGPEPTFTPPPGTVFKFNTWVELWPTTVQPSLGPWLLNDNVYTGIRLVPYDNGATSGYVIQSYLYGMKYAESIIIQD